MFWDHRHTASRTTTSAISSTSGRIKTAESAPWIEQHADVDIGSAGLVTLFHDFSPHRENYSSGFLQVRLKKSHLHSQAGGGFFLFQFRLHTFNQSQPILSARKFFGPRPSCDRIGSLPIRLTFRTILLAVPFRSSVGAALFCGKA
jgi:hypothetical protein